MPLNTVVVVSTLDDMDMLDLDGSGPWPGEPDPEVEDAYPVSWGEVDAPLRDGVVSEDDLPNQWGEAIDTVLTRASGGPNLPPPDVFDALAWYLPIHYFGMSWGIYIREDAVLDLAACILRKLPPPRRGALPAVFGAVRSALGVLFLHEVFHHKIESFATRLEVVERQRRYCPYTDGVYRPLAKSGSDDLLEEALAVAESARRLRREQVYRRGIPDDVQVAAAQMLADWFPTLPPGYRMGPKFDGDPEFADARNRLSCEVHEARQHPLRRTEEWDLMPLGHGGLFNCKTATHVLVPVGTTPIIPWFDRAPRPLVVSTKDMLKALRADGYEVVPGGKGSHIKLKKPGEPTLHLPANREALSPGVLRNVANALGHRSIQDLAKAVRS